MVFIGTWPLLISTMDIETTDFALLPMNLENRMQMLSPEGGRIWLTTTLGKRLKLNSYLTAFLLRVGSRGLQKLMISWRQVFQNSSQRYQVEATCTPHVHFKAGWDGSRVKQPPSMNSFGHLGIEDTRIVCQLHGMCCFEGFCLAQQVYHCQK